MSAMTPNENDDSAPATLYSDGGSAIASTVSPAAMLPALKKTVVRHHPG